jgi:hypothetical protein
MKKIDKPQNDKRILARRVAREMSKDELHAVTGGTTSCSCGGPDDCDQQQL